MLGWKPATFALEPADSGGLARWVLPSVLAVVRRCCTSCARRAVAEHAELSQRRYLQTRPRVLTLRTFPRPGRTVAFDRCRVTVSGDKMTGKIEREGSSDAGTIEFVRAAKQ